MHQSHTLDVGMDVHKASIAVAYVATDQDAEVISLGTFGTRQWDIDTLMRQRQSKATHLVFVSEAGPCGSRQAPDGGKEGGNQPTDSSRINRRVFLAPALPIDQGEKTCGRRKKRAPHS